MLAMEARRHRHRLQKGLSQALGDLYALLALVPKEGGLPEVSEAEPVMQASSCQTTATDNSHLV